MSYEDHSDMFLWSIKPLLSNIYQPNREVKNNTLYIELSLFPRLVKVLKQSPKIFKLTSPVKLRSTHKKSSS